MAKRKKEKRFSFPSIFYIFKTVVILSIFFFILEASFLAREGKIQEASIVGFAVIALAFFVFAFTLLTGAVRLGLLKSEKGSELFVGGKSSIYEESRDFVLGFGLFFLIGKLSNSFTFLNSVVIDMGSSIFAQAGEILGTQTFKGMFMNTVGAPVSEEIVFFVLMPLIFIYLMIDLADNYKKLSFLRNKFVQLLIYVPIVAYLFAGFHIGQAGVTAFFISALIFRSILLVLGYDSRSNIINGVFIGVLFAIGGHMANNIIQTGGLINWIQVMASPSFSDPLLFFAGYGTLAVVFGMLITFTLGTLNRIRKKL